MAIIQEILDEVNRSRSSGQSVSLCLKLGQPGGVTRGMALNFLTPASGDDRVPAGTIVNEIYLDEEYVLGVKSPMAGYLSVFNLGTSGRVKRILPLDISVSPRRIEADQLYWIPGPGFEMANWVELGPLTEENGLNEQLLVIVTCEPRVLTEHELHHDIPANVTRGLNPLGSISELYGRPASEVAFGVLSLPVLTPPTT